MPRVHPAFMQTNFNEWICMYQSIWCIYSRLANRLLNSISCSILPLEIWVHNAHRSALIICCVSYRWGWYYAAIENLLLVICGNSKLASTQLPPPPLSLWFFLPLPSAHETLTEILKCWVKAAIKNACESWQLYWNSDINAVVLILIFLVDEVILYNWKLQIVDESRVNATSSCGKRT